MYLYLLWFRNQLITGGHHLGGKMVQFPLSLRTHLRIPVMSGSNPDEYMGLAINGGTPQNRVLIRESPTKMDDLGVPPIFGNLHIHKPLSHQITITSP